MELCWITLHVSDMERSLTFYNGVLGLPVTRRFSPAPGTEIAMLGEGVLVELVCGGKNRTQRDAGFSIGMLVDALDDAMARVQSMGVPVAAGPVSPAPGARFCFIDDPDGIRVQLVEQGEG